MNAFTRQSLFALRGLIAAAGFVGALAILYTWGAPWIIWVVDNWKQLSDWLFGWIPLETTPEGRLSASFIVIFFVVGFLTTFFQAIQDNDTIDIISGIVLLFLVPIGIYFQLISKDYGALWTLGPILYLLGLRSATAFTIWFTVWVGAFFLLDYAYRHEWHRFLEAPPS